MSEDYNKRAWDMLLDINKKVSQIDKRSAEQEVQFKNLSRRLDEQNADYEKSQKEFYRAKELSEKNQLELKELKQTVAGNKEDIDEDLANAIKERDEQQKDLKLQIAGVASSLNKLEYILAVTILATLLVHVIEQFF